MTYVDFFIFEQLFIYGNIYIIFSDFFSSLFISFSLFYIV